MHDSDQHPPKPQHTILPAPTRTGPLHQTLVGLYRQSAQTSFEITKIMWKAYESKVFSRIKSNYEFEFVFIPFHVSFQLSKVTSLQTK